MSEPIRVWGVAVTAPAQKAAAEAHCFGDCGKISMACAIADELTGGLFVCSEPTCPYMAREFPDYGTTMSFGRPHAITLRLLQPLASHEPLALRFSEGLGVTRADFECEWTPAEKDNKLRELALRYHAETEAYDRTVCTGPIVDGSIQPFGPRQAALINRNANKVFQQIKEEAAHHGIDFAEMWRAIGRHA